jgi:hypothetical protein
MEIENNPFDGTFSGVYFDFKDGRSWPNWADEIRRIINKEFCNESHDNEDCSI